MSSVVSPSEKSFLQKIKDHRRALVAYAALLAAAVCFFLKLQSLPANAVLTGDELWGATLAPMSFLKALLFVLRFDIHPPLYYLQLNLWARAGLADGWLQLNSTLWLLAASGVVFRFLYQRVSLPAALAAAAFALTTPFLAAYGLEVRMYTLLAFLATLTAFLTPPLVEQSAREGGASKKKHLALFFTDLAIIYCYPTAPLILIAQFFYGAFLAWDLRLKRPFFYRWTGFHVLLAVMAVPVFLNSMFRKVAHSTAPTASDVFDSLSLLATGTPTPSSTPEGSALLVLVAGLILFSALVSVRARRLIVCYAAIPLLLGFLVSHVLKPIWLPRSFLFIMPLLGMSFGLVMASQIKPVLRNSFLSLLCLVVLLGGWLTWKQAEEIPPKPNYSLLANDLRALAKAGDCVMASAIFDSFWGVVRYYVGPTWADGMTVQAPPSEAWERILARVEPHLPSWISFAGRTDRFEHNGVTLIAGFSDARQPACARTFFVGRESDFQKTFSDPTAFKTDAINADVFIRERLSKEK